MSENNHEELFKTTLMGGFDKDDVMTKVQNLKDQAYACLLYTSDAADEL